MNKTVAERVSAGIALLDEKKPGWASLVDLESLDMASTSWCILGQVFDGYTIACDFLGISHTKIPGYRDMQARCGFDASAEAYGNACETTDFLNLQEEWAQRIEGICGTTE